MTGVEKVKEFPDKAKTYYFLTTDDARHTFGSVKAADEENSNCAEAS